MPKDFSQVLQQVPEEQRRVLERMAKLGLATGFAWSDETGQWAIDWTPSGRHFLALVRAVTSENRDYREASLLALDMLAAGKAVIGGFARE